MTLLLMTACSSEPPEQIAVSGVESIYTYDYQDTSGLEGIQYFISKKQDEQAINKQDAIIKERKQTKRSVQTKVEGILKVDRRGDVTTVKLKATQTGSDAKGPIHMEIEYTVRLLQEKGQWKIDDIQSSPKGWTKIRDSL